MNVLSVVCALLSQCWNATDMLERSWKWSPCLEFWIRYHRFGGQVDDFFRHLLAEIFGAISLCSFWKGRLKENHLSAVTGRGVDRIYIYTVYIFFWVHDTCIYIYIYIFINIQFILHTTSIWVCLKIVYSQIHWIKYHVPYFLKAILKYSPFAYTPM